MILQLHLSHVFDAISFRSMFINKGFLVILRLSTFFETPCIRRIADFLNKLKDFMCAL